MTDEEFAQQYEIACLIVASWPAWKQTLLEDCGKPTVREPRQPVLVED